MILLASAIAQAHFTLVAPLAVTETQPIVLGEVYARPAAYCQLLGTARTGNGCGTGSGHEGTLSLTGQADARVLVKLSTVTNDEVMFEPLLPNGTQQQQLQLQQGATQLSIGGKLTVLKEGSGERALNYTIEVLYD